MSHILKNCSTFQKVSDSKNQKKKILISKNTNKLQIRVYTKCKITLGHEKINLRSERAGGPRVPGPPRREQAQARAASKTLASEHPKNSKAKN